MSEDLHTTLQRMRDMERDGLLTRDNVKRLREMEVLIGRREMLEAEARGDVLVVDNELSDGFSIGRIAHIGTSWPRSTHGLRMLNALIQSDARLHVDLELDHATTERRAQMHANEVSDQVAQSRLPLTHAIAKQIGRPDMAPLTTRQMRRHADKINRKKMKGLRP
jgi:SAM-dependent MidA family methyltransferase